MSLCGVCAGLHGRDLWDLFLKEDLGLPCLLVVTVPTLSFRALFLCEFVKKHFRKKNQHVCQVDVDVWAGPTQARYWVPQGQML